MNQHEQLSPQAHFWISSGILIGSGINWWVSGWNPFIIHIDWPIGYVVTPLAWTGAICTAIGLIEWANNRWKRNR